MVTDPVQSHLAQGERHLEAGEWSEAEAAFRRALEINPESAPAYSKLGVAMIHQRRMDEAEAAFARAIDKNPRYAPAWSNLGNVYRETGRTEQALEAYQRAIAADPDYWVAHQNLGGLYKQLGRMTEAIASLRRATRLSAKSAFSRPGAAGSRRPGCLGRAAALLVLLIAVALAL
jgi:superkiller protein 3